MDRQHRNFGKVCAECRRCFLALPRQLAPRARILGIGELVAVEVGERPLGYSDMQASASPTAAAGCLTVGDSRPPPGESPRQRRWPPPWLMSRALPESGYGPNLYGCFGPPLSLEFLFEEEAVLAGVAVLARVAVLDDSPCG